MADQIFLIAPDDATPESFAQKLDAVLAAAPIAVLLLPLGARSDADYAALAEMVIPRAQAQGVAVLLDNRPDLVEPLGADGVHVTSGTKAIKEAIEALKPDYIVGTGDLGSRHDAMERGECDIDYLLFGDRAESDAEMANWWAETFEVPSVYLAPAADAASLADIGTEFIGFSGDIWDKPDALAALTDASA